MMYAVQDLCSTYPTQETSAINMLDRSDHSALTWRHDLHKSCY